MFSKKDGDDFKNGGILREKVPSAAGFRIDTGYYNNDPLDKNTETSWAIEGMGHLLK